MGIDNLFIDEVFAQGGGLSGPGLIDISPVNINAGDISGGSTSGAIAASAAQIEEFVSQAGRALPKFYGRHFIAGILIVHKFIDNSPADNESYVAVAIGEGQGFGGGHGELEGAEIVWYAGDPLTANPSPATDPGYRFYRGHISSGIADANQPVDPYFSSIGLAYSGTGYIAVRIPTLYVNKEDRPDKLRGIYLGRRTKNFNASGQEIGYGYSTNPARVAADLILGYYERKFPLDAALALRLLQEKIDWEAWKIWHDFNEQLIEWDDGTSVRNIKRFECHLALTDNLDLASALDQICASCGAFWQDDGKQIIFLPPTEREPVHHFHPGNLLSKGITVEPRDLRNAHNFFTGEFHDQDNEFLGLAPVDVRLENLIRQSGENKITHSLPSMNQSQARRLMRMRARLESENPNICAFVGDARSYRVLPGDFVTASHPTTGWNYQRLLVLDATLVSAENGVDVSQFTAQQINAPLYLDTDHLPRQEALTP
jgi:hypothetical protein